MRRALVLIAFVAGCGADLPDPKSPGAIVLRDRCGGCHRPFLPGTMTIDMWKMQMGRMRQLYAQRGIPWLRPEEERVLLEYLGAHAGTS